MKKSRNFRHTVVAVLTFVLVLSTLGMSKGSDVSYETNHNTGVHVGSFHGAHFERESLLQARASEAWVVLYNSFPLNEMRNGVIYPDDFAGGWIDGQYLRILLTSDTPEVLNRYKGIFGEHKSHVIFETAEYSLNTLNKILDILVDNLTESGFSLTGGGINDKENNIRLWFDNLDERNRIETFLSDFVSQDLSAEIAEISSFGDNARSLSDVGVDVSLFSLSVMGRVTLCNMHKI
jgi:hypothetical protein